MENEKNMTMKIDYFLKVNILNRKKMEKEKNMILKED